MAQNLVDADDDGLVDVPNDQGDRTVTIAFDFEEVGPVIVTAVTLVDVDTGRIAPVLELIGEAGEPARRISLPTGGDNSVVTVETGHAEPVTAVVLTLSGSGAVDRIEFVSGGCTPQP